MDNLLERVVASGNKKVVRLGHPARLLTAIHDYSLDAMLAGSEETQLVRDVRKDMDTALVCQIYSSQSFFIWEPGISGMKIENSGTL